MSSVTVRISGRAYDELRELASKSGVSMAAILDRAIDEYWRLRFLEEANASFAALRADPQAWRAELAERGEWDTALADGIEDEPAMPE